MSLHFSLFLENRRAKVNPDICQIDRNKSIKQNIKNEDDIFQCY